jgi:hypothetical protein
MEDLTERVKELGKILSNGEFDEMIDVMEKILAKGKIEKEGSGN